ncbi:MAG: hypothetical protein CM1200mP16_08910 [Nitrospina sp.]|nr:MAG: hypothetical protein CM1200mP16_08910 [Nitrospina sp.]
MIRELIARTNRQVKKLNADEIIETGKTVPARNLLLAHSGNGYFCDSIIAKFLATGFNKE